jgi:hypothetical protein
MPGSLQARCTLEPLRVYSDLNLGWGCVGGTQGGCCPCEINLSRLHTGLPAVDAEQLIGDYRHLIKLTNPETISYPDKDLVRLKRHLICHAADVPVPLSAIASKPDWLLIHKTKHFTNASLKGHRCISPGSRVLSDAVGIIPWT